mgnify:CR=1 FL=1
MSQLSEANEAVLDLIRTERMRQYAKERKLKIGGKDGR